MLWVEQPVGTGFSQGIPNITNEDGVAAQLVGFFQQFLEVFRELKGKKFYMTGESVNPQIVFQIYISHNQRSMRDIIYLVSKKSSQNTIKLTCL